MRGAGERLASHLALGVATAALVGAADALYALLAAGAWSSASSLLLAAALMLPVGVLVGLAAFAIDELLVRRGALPFLRARLAAGSESSLWALAWLLAL